MIRIEKLIMLGLTYDIGVECSPRDRVYGVKLSRLRLNITEELIKRHAIIGYDLLLYGIRFDCMDQKY